MTWLAAPVMDLETHDREGKIAPDDFVILAQSKPIPYCTFGVAKGPIRRWSRR